MGVISFGDDRPVWGSSASFMRGLVRKAIDLHGTKEYLLHLNYLLEWMYNHLDMTELHVSELQELLSAIEPYRVWYLDHPGLSETTRASVGQLLDELAAMLGSYVGPRKAANQITVTRDLWTLRSVADTERRLREPLPEIPDPDAFVIALGERVRDTLHLRLQGPAISGELPLADRMSNLGAHIGEFPTSLDYPEAIFRLIEDGMESDNEVVSAALVRHLIPAMVEASVGAGTWEALLRQLGEETRRWAMEHYDFEFNPPETSGLFPSELRRLQELVQAAKASDWSRFRALSDEPYANEESMKEQFKDAAASIEDMKRCRILQASASVARGNRMILAEIGDPAAKKRIHVMLSNIGNSESGPFGVWTFALMPDWS